MLTTGSSCWKTKQNKTKTTTTTKTCSLYYSNSNQIWSLIKCIHNDMSTKWLGVTDLANQVCSVSKKSVKSQLQFIFTFGVNTQSFVASLRGVLKWSCNCTQALETEHRDLSHTPTRNSALALYSWHLTVANLSTCWACFCQPGFSTRRIILFPGQPPP